MVGRGHNYGLCRKCSRFHIHPKGTLGKNLIFKDIERRRELALNNVEKLRKLQDDEKTIEKIRNMYKSGMTQAEIGREIGLSQRGVGVFMRRNNITARPAPQFKKGYTPTEKQLDALKRGRILFVKGQKGPREGMGNKAKCHECGKTFKRPPAQMNEYNFCSRMCYTTYRIKHPELMSLPIPNKGEIELYTLLKTISNDWDFIGDGGVWIEGKCPDFWDGKNKLIELYGGAWHSHKEGKERVKFFEKQGYSCLIIWYSELRKPKILKEKLISWIEHG